MDDEENFEEGAAWATRCVCGRRFYRPSTYTNHINGCTLYKKDVGSSLDGARARFKERKSKAKKGKAALTAWFGEDNLDVDSIPAPAGPSQASHFRDREEELYTIPTPMEYTPDLVAQTRVERQVDYEPDVTVHGRGLRTRKPVQKFKDFALTSTIPFNIPSLPLEDPDREHGTDSVSGTAESHPQAHNAALGASTAPEAARGTVWEAFSWRMTPKNDFGLYKKYWTTEEHPHDPDSYISGRDLLEEDPASELEALVPDAASRLHPFPNMNSFLLGEWYWSDRSEKSRESFRELLDIITSEAFDPQDIRAADWNRINSALASSEFDERGESQLDWIGDGTSWQSAVITLEVPFNSTSLDPGPHSFQVPDLRYRPLVPIITERLKDVTRGEQFHIVPTDLRWLPDDGGPDARVYGELYNSPAFIDAFKEVQNLPPEAEDDHLPRYVVGLMFASDQTMLTSFGNAKIWPVYMLFGNESKNRRSKASLKLFEEIAYFQSLPDNFQDWYLNLSGKKNVGDPLKTFLNRELFHAQWTILLDDDFVNAYQHGIVVTSFDGVTRRFYPRIMTYSADYPERVSVVGVRNNRDRPCPRCLVSACDIHQMGSLDDRMVRNETYRTDDEDRRDKIEQARHSIFKKHLNVNSGPVEAKLKPTSLVPAQNAFSDRLSSLGLDIFRTIAVDVLHEVEIGVWKSLFIHLLRILESVDVALVHTLNHRFRQVPGFGRDTIRRFGNNVSEMKQFAAREYEDILQCAILVFDGLLVGSHGDRLLDVLFVFAYWHALVKLRLHTDETLSILDEWTTILGEQARAFASDTANSFKTKELRREYEARKRRQARENVKKSKGKRKTRKARSAARGSSPSEASSMPENSGRRSKTWNLNTPKFHSLGDVASYIRRFGTTDSYSTQLSERFHRFPKGRYRRTNKKKTAYQISRIQTRQARIKKLRTTLTPSPDEGASEEPDKSSYFVGKSQNQPVQLSRFVFVNSKDRAVRDFIPKLKRHVYPRVVEKLLQEARLDPESHSHALPVLQDLNNKETFSERDLDNIYVHSERIYQHSIVQVNYTTYDCRRDQDTLNSSTTRRDIMCLRNNGGTDTTTSKRFIYGHLLGVFHVNIVYGGPGTLDHRPRRFDFLWVRWYEPLDPDMPDTTIWSTKRLERLALKPLSNPAACDFVDPADVVRAAHIVPRFSAGKVYEEHDTQPKVLFSKWARDREEWKEYYLNVFADRDMLMRFHWGMAVGHTYAHRKSPDEDHSPASTSNPRVGETVSANDRQHEPMDVDGSDSDSDVQVLEVYSSTDSEDSLYDRNGAASEEDLGDGELHTDDAQSTEGDSDDGNDSDIL